ncbi:hypothetical protein AS159_08170 [Thermotoga sp. Ku-13t]|nr:hypothetical protein AS159_08170 [Thermotoga sp. Ku-13t]
MTINEKIKASYHFDFRIINERKDNTLKARKVPTKLAKGKKNRTTVQNHKIFNRLFVSIVCFSFLDSFLCKKYSTKKYTAKHKRMIARTRGKKLGPGNRVCLTTKCGNFRL